MSNRRTSVHSLSELVKDGTNGLVFNSAEQLAKQLEVRATSHYLGLRFPNHR